MAKSKDNNKELTFEAALEELEIITEKMAQGNTPLEETMKLFERGMELNKFCMDKIGKAKEKIKLIVDEDEDVREEDFDTDDDE